MNATQEGKSQQPNRKRRGALFALLLACGVILEVPVQFLRGVTLGGLLLALAALFFGLTLLSRRNPGLQSFGPVLFAFSTFATVTLLQGPLLGWLLGSLCLPGSNCTLPGLFVFQVAITLLVVVPIVILTTLFGGSLASLYMGKGHLRRGLVPGLGGFLAFFLTAVQVSQFLFSGRPMAFDRFLGIAPWLVVIVLMNGLREELYFRGLFLRRYEASVDPAPANYLQAIVFSLAHLNVTYSPYLWAFLVFTFFLGLWLGHSIQWTNSLLGPALFHAGADLPIYLAFLSST